MHHVGSRPAAEAHCAHQEEQHERSKSVGTGRRTTGEPGPCHLGHQLQTLIHADEPLSLRRPLQQTVPGSRPLRVTWVKGHFGCPRRSYWPFPARSLEVLSKPGQGPRTARPASGQSRTRVGEECNQGLSMPEKPTSAWCGSTYRATRARWSATGANSGACAPSGSRRGNRGNDSERPAAAGR